MKLMNRGMEAHIVAEITGSFLRVGHKCQISSMDSLSKNVLVF